MEVTKQTIAQWRLASQHIAQADFVDAADVVKHMVALQAQDYGGALWSISLRTSNLTKQAVEQAIVDRTIVRTWPMRGTLHLVAADDMRWMVNLLAPRAIAAGVGRRRALGLDDITIERARAVVINVLSNDHCLSRGQLCMVLDQKGIATTGQRGIHLLHLFAEQGLICFGPHDGKQPTFVLVDEWLPPTKPKQKNEALGELARRYFTSHGPASLKDFAGWSNLTISDAKTGIEIAKNDLTKLVHDGVEYWTGDQSNIHANDTVALLPGFDEFMLGYKDRSASLVPEFSERIVPGGNGMFLPTLVINGSVVGTWKRTTRSASQSITITPFTTISSDYTSRIAAAVARYGVFSDTTTTWDIAH